MKRSNVGAVYSELRAVIVNHNFCLVTIVVPQMFYFGGLDVHVWTCEYRGTVKCGFLIVKPKLLSPFALCKKNADAVCCLVEKLRMYTFYASACQHLV